jgi:hypothetical protein
MAYRFRPQNNLINRNNNHVIFNPIPWYSAAFNIQNQPNFNQILNATGSYGALNDLREDLYSSTIEDELIPQEIRDQIDLMIIREMNQTIDQNTPYSANFTTIELDEILSSQNPIENIKAILRDDNNLLNVDFSDNTEQILTHYINIWRNRRRDEQNLAIVGLQDRPRFNILLFPIGRIGTRAMWHMLVSIPIFKGRHLISLFGKVTALLRKTERIGLAFNNSFQINTVKFFLYQRPYTPSQVFMQHNTLLTLSASLVSPTFASEVAWQSWLFNLTRWFNTVDRRREVLSDEEIMQQFQIEINVDQTSYLRSNEIFNMIESIYRNRGDVLRSYIFVVDVGMSSDLTRTMPAPPLEQFR